MARLGLLLVPEYSRIVGRRFQAAKKRHFRAVASI